MRVAALEAERVAQGLPPRLAACVIEDIDTRRRTGTYTPDAELSEEQQQQLRRWEAADGRRFDTWESCEAALLPWYGNDKKRIATWKGPNASTRVSPCKDGSGWWSDHNPAAKRLAQKTVLDTDDAVKAWQTLATAAHAEEAATAMTADSQAAAVATTSRCPLCVAVVSLHSGCFVADCGSPASHYFALGVHCVAADICGSLDRKERSVGGRAQVASTK